MQNDFEYAETVVRDLPLHINHAGYIVNLREGRSGGVAIIDSNAGSVRSNHWHKTDSHLLYVVQGALLYFERAIGDQHIPDPYLFTPGNMFYTPARVEHACLFLVDTTLVSISDRQRDHASHEEDVVRVDFLTPLVLQDLFRKMDLSGDLKDVERLSNFYRRQYHTSGKKIPFSGA